MSESMGHPLDRRDNADAPRCPMERLADRMNDCKKPEWLNRFAFRTPGGAIEFELSGYLTSPERLDDLINFLSRVKG